ncbi:3-oxoacyl-ACP synthase III family protein [Streptomyces olivaceus]|nr:3-oxoacyl-ACP synthase III family protein [Streptomyces olivaceus]MBZ6128100.1 3-oxoacyl-ACP synthase III family protein [Streptomyces olivaceus]MBZ6148961.1 3-oxoacyl-ACP synthase III family protein [Streptomyces olivaceus]MBZ6162720.1 3-oxoacyl-ACP synthase III family protein [Streptomyces olivaceus]MBZ6190523.1 3-oxoacyl-ACP synthase III family protein [Streptomyces olivaceus]
MRTEMSVYLHSAGTVLPGPPIDIASLAEKFDLPSVWGQWVESFIDNPYRHYSVDLDSGKLRFSLADLATTAGERALAAAGAAPADVDLLVMGTSSPDMLMPATVNVVADRLGIDDVATYQLQSGCTGAIQALDVARRLLGSGEHRTALVIGADSCAKHLDLSVDVRSLPPDQQVNGVLFGDGAGAAVLGVERGAHGVELLRTRVRCVGRGREPGQTLNWFGGADRHADRPAAVEDYKAVQDAVPPLAVQTLDEMLDALNWDRGEVDYVLPPQLSGRMTDEIHARLDVPDAQEVSCVRETGNTGNALPFFQLERLLPRMIAGDRAVGVAIESSKWIKAGYALEKVDA